MPAHRFSVLLGADSLVGARSGVGRMTLEIARRLGDRPQLQDFNLLIGGRIFEPGWLEGLDSCPDASSPLPLSSVRQFVSDLELWRRWRDKHRRAELCRATEDLRRRAAGHLVYHEPNMITVPYDGPTIASFNDLSWHWEPSYHPAGRIAWISRNLPRVLHETTRFVAISQFTAEEMIRELGIARDRIDIVPLAPAPVFAPMSKDDSVDVLRKYGLDDQHYVFSISTREPRKNFDRLLAAHLALPEDLRRRIPLVVAGADGWGSVLKDAGQAIAAGQLRLLGHIPDSDLAVLTARCTVFAYVSLYEGFGLPVVEAMAAGAPVIASSTTAVGETSGFGALCVDPESDKSITEALRLMLEDDGARRKWRAAGLARSRDFSWSHSVDCLMESWQRALGGEQPLSSNVLQTAQLG